FGSKLAGATLSVDASRLRQTLDALRVGLERPMLASPISSAALVHDRKAIAESVRYILDRLGTVDLAAIQAMSGVVTEYRSENTARELRDLFGQLQHGWQERIRTVLGVQK